MLIASIHMIWLHFQSVRAFSGRGPAVTYETNLSWLDSLKD
jgi:hypothetical protein